LRRKRTKLSRVIFSLKSSHRKFVVQEHTKSGQIHWDLMLEKEDTLETWRLSKASGLIKNEIVPATKIFDHDKKFLTYEGSVNNGLGNVRIIDSGNFEILEGSKDRIRIKFDGTFLSGEFLLETIAQDQWQFLRIV
jgi:hypothetical protein